MGLSEKRDKLSTRSIKQPTDVRLILHMGQKSYPTHVSFSISPEGTLFYPVARGIIP